MTCTNKLQTKQWVLNFFSSMLTPVHYHSGHCVSCNCYVFRPPYNGAAWSWIFSVPWQFCCYTDYYIFRFHKSASYPWRCHVMNIQCALVFISWTGNRESVVLVHGSVAVTFYHFYKIAYSTTAPSCAGFLEFRRLRFGPLKSTFITENFRHGLSWSICGEFGAFKVIQGNCSQWQLKACVWLLISD